MSILIDKLLKEADTSTTAQAKDLKWYKTTIFIKAKFKRRGLRVRKILRL